MSGHHHPASLPPARRGFLKGGAANCIQSLDDIAREQGEFAMARKHYVTTLALYERIRDLYSIGWTHLRLAELANGPDRTAHVAASHAAWTSINRPDLVARLDKFD
jgi:hypothetical protein